VSASASSAVLNIATGNLADVWGWVAVGVVTAGSAAVAVYATPSARTTDRGPAPAQPAIAADPAPRDDTEPGTQSLAPAQPPRELYGRGPLVGLLRGLLAAPVGNVRVQVLYGLGGTGKTAIAAELARQWPHPAWWVSAASAATLHTGMREVARRAGAPDALIEQAWAGDRSATDLVWNTLAAVASPWLLVLDNADDLALLTPDGSTVGDGTGWLRPPPPDGTVLVTTRDHETGRWNPRWAGTHAVPPLNPPAGGALLRQLAPGAGPEADAETLSTRLGGLPLALRLAGQYLADAAAAPHFPDDGPRPTTFAAYHEALRTRAGALERLLGGRRTAAARDRALITRTFELSLDLLARRGAPQARPMLRLLACFGPGAVPCELLLDPAILRESPLFPDDLDGDAVREGLRSLAGLGLAELGTDAVAGSTATLHPVVRDANRAHPDVLGHRREYADLMVALLRAATPATAPEDTAGWPRWAVLAVHSTAPLRLLQTD
jgi:hypothetical protein